MRGRISWILPSLMSVSLAAATAPSPPATTQAAGPREALAGMFRAMLSGDEAGTMNALVFGSADTRQAAEAMLRQILATARLRRAIIQQFDARGQDSPVGKKQEDDVKGILKALASAPVRLTGNAADVTLDNGQTFVMVQRDGAWKVDFDKSQEGMGGMPARSDVDAAQKRTAALGALTGEVVSHRIAALSEIESRYQAIMGDAADVDTAPATRP